MLTVIALIGAVAAPLVTYLVAARRFSGKIQTSDAKELWEESRSIRDWSERRIRELEGRLGKLEDVIRELRSSLAECEKQLLAARRRLYERGIDA